MLIDIPSDKAHFICRHDELPHDCDIDFEQASSRRLGIARRADGGRYDESTVQKLVVGRGSNSHMRGIKTESFMSNSVVRGKFRDLSALRAEALRLMGL